MLDFLANADPNGNIWYVAVSAHNKIVLDFYQKLGWPKPRSVLEYEEEESKKDEEYKCSSCGEIFTPRDNESTDLKCKIHANYQEYIFEPGNNQPN